MSTAKHRRAVAWAALGQYAAKQLARDDLAHQTNTPLDLVIAGKVDRKDFSAAVGGIVAIGAPSIRTSSVACDQAELLAQFACRLGPVQRRMFYDLLADHFEKRGELPSADPQVTEECRHLLKRLRFSKSVEYAAPVKFDPAGGGK